MSEKESLPSQYKVFLEPVGMMESSLREVMMLLDNLIANSTEPGPGNINKIEGIEDVEYIRMIRNELYDLQTRADAVIQSLKAKEHRVTRLQTEIDKLRRRLSALENFEKRSAKEGGVFVSYSHADKNIVDILVERFELDKINYWLDDKDLHIGQVIDKAISDGIQKSWIFLLVLSPSSIKSKWVQREFEEASYEEIEGKKIILPIICNGLKANGVPTRIRRKLYVDVSQDFEVGYQKLKQSIIFHLQEYNAVNKKSMKKSRNPPDN
jgi:regulator of replication initiation timing